MERIITFDFHNTLVRCDPWFELEVRELPAAFLIWRASHLGVAPPPGTDAAARIAYRHLRRRIVEHGQELPAERCVAEVLKELGVSVEESTIAAGVESVMRNTLAAAEPVAGALGTVRQLACSGATLAVISSAVYHPFLVWALDRFEMMPYFAAVITSASAGYYKSRTEIFDLAVRELGGSPTGSVHVGDSLIYDVGTAKRAGMGTVWLSDTAAPDGGETPDLTLSSLEGAASAILAVGRSPAVNVGIPLAAR